MGNSFRISADIGGTFTDIVYQDVVSGRCGATKVLSTPENPALAVLDGIDEALGEDGNIAFFVHGTTVGLNALLTRKGSKVALVTNENFRDIYTIQGNNRGEIFSIQWNKPKPLAALEDSYTVAGRIAADGEELTPLRLADLDTLIEACAGKAYDAIAISLLFSYVNKAHEVAVRDYLATRLPDTQIVMSHEVSPEWREFERTSTTVTDAYLAPVVRKYIATLQDQMGSRLPEGGNIHVMESNGGVMTATTASQTPLQTLLSGPVGGAIGGKALSATTGRSNLICVDMGGTSFDASLVIDGLPSTSNEAVLEGLPLQMSVVDIHVIGAGGGSIAWTEAGAMRVGPQSAGSVPGPICYALGGKDVTVSDANLVLGRLDGANFSGGQMTLNRDLAAAALTHLGAEFSLDAEGMAQGVIDIVNAKMADAIRTITIQRGIDPREFSLAAFGGAGPAQAVALAEELEISEVIIPVYPGAFSAWGMLQTDVKHDFKETLYSFWDLMELDALQTSFASLEQRGLTFLTDEGITEDRVAFERAIDFRYYGQEYVLTIPLADGPIDMDKIRVDFDAAYLRQYGHNSPENRVEMANIRLSALGLLERPANAAAVQSAPLPERQRDVWFGGTPHATRILDRNAIGDDDKLQGPAIIEEATSTTLLPPGWTAQLVADGHMSLTKEAHS